MFVDLENPNHKGNVAEPAVAKEAASLGLTVFMPLTEHERYDLIIGMVNGRFSSDWRLRETDSARHYTLPMSTTLGL